MNNSAAKTKPITLQVEANPDAVKQADADPHPDLQERFDDVLAAKYPLEK